MKNVLIVEDEPSTRRLLIRTLEGETGYQLFEAKDAAQARSILQSREIHLVLSDIQMPGESGLHLAQHIKRTYPDTGIVLVTSVSSPEEVKAALDLGLYGYVLKPIDTRQVLITVDNALRRQELEIKNKKACQELKQNVIEKTSNLNRITKRSSEVRECSARKTPVFPNPHGSHTKPRYL
jgi:DNA-binding NtrC family response regulator